MRSSTWITAGFAQKYAGENGANFNCEYLTTHPSIKTYVSTDTEEQKETFKKNPDEYLRYRKLVEAELNQRFRFVRPLAEAMVRDIF